MSLVDQKHKNEAVRGKDNDWLVGKNESHEVIFYIRRVKVDKSRLQQIKAGKIIVRRDKLCKGQDENNPDRWIVWQSKC